MSTISEQEKNMRALISASNAVAKDEGITDDDKIVVRMNEIYNDAKNPIPTTDAGKKAREVAIDILKANELAEKQGRNPWMVGGYDYEAFFDERVPSAVVQLFQSLGKFAKVLAIPSQSKLLTPEQEKEFDDGQQTVSLEWFKILNENKVPVSKYPDIFKELRDTVSALERIMQDQIAGHNNEILSRIHRAINPGTNLLDLNFSTYQDIIDTREKLKSEQDEADGEDLYSFRKKDADTEDSR